jgi:hypothetical protein
MGAQDVLSRKTGVIVGDEWVFPLQTELETTSKATILSYRVQLLT